MACIHTLSWPICKPSLGIFILNQLILRDPLSGPWDYAEEVVLLQQWWMTRVWAIWVYGKVGIWLMNSYVPWLGFVPCKEWHFRRHISIANCVTLRQYFPLGLLLDFTWCFSLALISLIKEGLLAQGARYSLDLTVGIPAYLVIFLVAQWHLWFDLILTLLLFNSIFEELWTRVRTKCLHSAASLAELSCETPEMDSRKGCFYSMAPEVALYCSQ